MLKLVIEAKTELVFFYLSLVWLLYFRFIDIYVNVVSDSSSLSPSFGFASLTELANITFAEVLRNSTKCNLSGSLIFLISIS